MTDDPRRTALYRLYDADTLLYVGVAYDPEGRWKQHAVDKPWWSLVDRREVEWHPDRATAGSVERKAIRSEAPLYNGTDGNASRAVDHFPVGETVGNSEARTRLTDLLDQTQFHGAAIGITRRGKLACYLIAPELYEEAVAVHAELARLRRKASELKQTAAE